MSELIRRIQQMRKDMKLDVEEYVRVEVRAPAVIEEYFKSWKEHIMKETRSLQMDFKNDPKGEREASWEVEKQRMDIALTSLHLKEGLKEFTKVPGLSQEGALAVIRFGKTKVEDLKGMDEAALTAIPGISKTDARNIAHYLARLDIVPKAEAAPVASKTLDTGDRDLMINYLMRVPRMNQLKAEMVIDAGYDTMEKIAKASKDDLRAVSGLGTKTVQEIMDHAAAGGFTKVTQCSQCQGMVQPYERECPACHAPVEVPVENVKPGEGTDGAEERSQTKPSQAKLEPTFTYLIKETKGGLSYSLFEGALSSGMLGYCVTREYPLKIRSKYNLGETPVVWLSNIGKENSLRPKDLEKLSFSLEQFLSKKDVIVLLDGLEYLITNNNFLTVLRFIQSLRDQVAINHSILMLAVNPSTLDPHELNLLEKEVDANL